jgi:hypothetical protein
MTSRVMTGSRPFVPFVPAAGLVAPAGLRPFVPFVPAAGLVAPAGLRPFVPFMPAAGLVAPAGLRPFVPFVPAAGLLTPAGPQPSGPAACVAAWSQSGVAPRQRLVSEDQIWESTDIKTYVFLRNEHSAK